MKHRAESVGIGSRADFVDAVVVADVMANAIGENARNAPSEASARMLIARNVNKL